MVPLETLIVPLPERIGRHRHQHTDQDAQERGANLPELEPVHVAEDLAECTEEEVQNPQKKRGVDAEVQTHGFEGKHLHWSIDGLEDGLRDGPLLLLHWRDVRVVAGRGPQLHRLAL